MITDTSDPIFSDLSVLTVIAEIAARTWVFDEQISVLYTKLLFVWQAWEIYI